MAGQTFPLWADQPGLTLHTFAITGASVGATAGTAGLDGRGKFLCTISKSTNTVTINWNQAFGDVPYVWFQQGLSQTNTAVQITTNTASQLVFQTVQADSHSTGVNDANLIVFVASYNTTSFVG